MPKLCWASHLGQCDPKYSKEHILSRSVASAIREPSDKRAGGFRISWLDKTLPTDAFQMHLLCRKHNSQLSGCDSNAAKFLGAIANGKRVARTNGVLFEKWLAKTFVNLCFFQNATTDDDIKVGGNPAEYTHGGSEVPTPYGLYITKLPYQVTVQPNVLRVENEYFDVEIHPGKAPGYRPAKIPLWIKVEVGGFLMVGYFNVSGASEEDFLTITEGPRNNLINGQTYRPGTIHTTGSGRKIAFEW